MKRCLIAALWLFLAGCSNRTEDFAVLDEYALRVSRVLEVDLATTPRSLAFPGSRTLRLPVAGQTIGWAAFAELHRCDMGDLAGFRNSGLGRVQQGLERLSYEVRWLQAADRCVARDTAVPESVMTVYRQKVAEIAPLLFNATVAGPEFRGWLGVDGRKGTASADQPLRQLYAAVPEIDAAAPVPGRGLDVDAIRGGLELLRGARQGGASIRYWERSRATLLAIAEALEAQAATVCRNARSTPRWQRLKRVFDRFYVAGVQPTLASRIAADRSWVRALAQLVDRLPVRSPAFDDWYAQAASETSTNSAWRELPAVTRRHAQAWQVLAERCGASLLPPWVSAGRAGL